MKSVLTLGAVVLLGASNVAAEYPAAALRYRGLNALVYQGCYSSVPGMIRNDTFDYQSKGHCQSQCAPMNKAVQATSARNQCWCGDDMPPKSDKVADTQCTSSCTGYGIEMCGGNGLYSVYLTGTDYNIDNTVAGQGGSDSPPTASASPSATTSANHHSSSAASTQASVVTIGGQTIVVTAPAESTNSGTAKSSNGGPNKAAIAAGVVVTIVVLAAAAGGLFLWLRHRKNRAIEEEYKRNAAVSSFIGGGKPTSSGGASSFTDTRLDATAMAQRRMSDGSIADNQDYSRRILKVTNA